MDIELHEVYLSWNVWMNELHIFQALLALFTAAEAELAFFFLILFHTSDLSRIILTDQVFRWEDGAAEKHLSAL